jgi:hypothetical protein
MLHHLEKRQQCIWKRKRIWTIVCIGKELFDEFGTKTAKTKIPILNRPLQQSKATRITS